MESSGQVQSQKRSSFFFKKKQGSSYLKKQKKNLRKGFLENACFRG